jgi:cysteine desulfurase/selenocysteine lyase
MTRLGLPGTARASFSFYNTLDEVAALVRALDRIRGFFS